MGPPKNQQPLVETKYVHAIKRIYIQSVSRELVDIFVGDSMDYFQYKSPLPPGEDC